MIIVIIYNAFMNNIVNATGRVLILFKSKKKQAHNEYKITNG